MADFTHELLTAFEFWFGFMAAVILTILTVAIVSMFEQQFWLGFGAASILVVIPSIVVTLRVWNAFNAARQLDLSGG